jgi:hypothetical protein
MQVNPGSLREACIYPDKFKKSIEGICLDYPVFDKTGYE